MTRLPRSQAHRYLELETARFPLNSPLCRLHAYLPSFAPARARGLAPGLAEQEAHGIAKRGEG